MVTHRFEKFWFYSHDVINRPSERTYVCPPLRVCQCDQYHASLQHTTLTLDIHVFINFHLSNQGIHWPVSRDHIAGSRLEITEVSFFFKFTADQVLVYDWIAGSTEVNSPKHKRGFIFCALSFARRGYKAILRQLYFLNSQRFSCSGGKRFGKCFLFAFFAGFNPVWHIIIAVVHTGGYAVIQVKHRRDINLKLSVYSLLFSLYCIFLEGLIRLHDAWRTYD